MGRGMAGQHRAQRRAEDRGKGRVISDRREPGSTRITGAPAPMPQVARNAAISASEACGSVTTGWPTKSQLIPSACM